MDKEDFYTQWKEMRRHVPVPGNFSGGVMAVIQKQTPGNNEELPAGLIHFPGRFIRWSTGAGLVILGLLRILYIAGNLIQANPLMP
jgi:hypothetical protein